MVNIFRVMHHRRFIQDFFEDNDQNVPPTANMLDELKAEFGLNEEQS